MKKTSEPAAPPHHWGSRWVAPPAAPATSLCCPCRSRIAVAHQRCLAGTQALFPGRRKNCRKAQGNIWAVALGAQPRWTLLSSPVLLVLRSLRPLRLDPCPPCQSACGRPLSAPGQTPNLHLNMLCNYAPSQNWLSVGILIPSKLETKWWIRT